MRKYVAIVVIAFMVIATSITSFASFINISDWSKYIKSAQRVYLSFPYITYMTRDAGASTCRIGSTEKPTFDGTTFIFNGSVMGWQITQETKNNFDSNPENALTYDWGTASMFGNQTPQGQTQMLMSAYSAELVSANYDVMNGTVCLYDSELDSTYGLGPSTITVNETVGAINVNYQGFPSTAYDSLDFRFTKFDYVNMDWSKKVDDSAVFSRVADGTGVFVFDKSRSIWIDSMQYGVTVDAWKNGVKTFTWTSMGTYGTGTRYRALPLTVEDYVTGSFIPPPRLFKVSNQVLTSGQNVTFIEWKNKLYDTDVLKYNAEIQVKRSADWVPYAIVTDSETFVKDKDDTITYYRMRNVDKQDNRKISEWTVVNASSVVQYQPPVDLFSENPDTVGTMDIPTILTKSKEFINTAFEGLNFFKAILGFLPEPIPSIVSLIFYLSIIMFVLRVVRG